MIIPTIETDSLDNIQNKLDLYAKVKFANKPTHLQIDVVDGLYANMVTVMPSDFNKINWHGFSYEVHLLVNEPDEYLGEVAGSKAVAVIAQVERMIDRNNFINTARELKLKVGLGLDLYTSVAELSEQELNELDVVLLMSVPAGYSGQELNPLIYDKLRELRRKGFDKSIEVDGGINSTNVKRLIEVGASGLAVNSAIWHDGAVTANLQRLL